MKRFRTPFQKIQSIQQQLLRISELKLVQAQVAVRKSEENIMRLEAEVRRHEQEISNRLSSGSFGLTIRDLLTNRTRIEDGRGRMQKEAEHRQQLKSGFIKAQADYQALKAKCDGVDQMLQKKKIEHRRLSLQNEQNQLEESARGLQKPAGFQTDSDRLLN